MTKKVKHNLTAWVICSIGSAIVLFLTFGWSRILWLSILIGFIFGLLNAIVGELRKLNGENFDNLEDDNLEL